MTDIIAKATRLIMDPTFPAAKGEIVLEIVKAARETALEEAAKLADDEARENMRVSEKPDTPISLSVQFNGRRGVAEKIAAAIRARKEKANEHQ